jgi:DNA-binding CsgD family transcriptional regulator
MEKLAQIRNPSEGSKAKGELGELTPRERDVLGLICKGHGDADIAALLKVSRNTVRNHIATLYAKIGVNRRSAAVIWGRERGIVSY